jgi:hypothetical protein
VLCQKNASASSGIRESVPSYPVEWWVKFQVKRNGCRYISTENSGYSEYNVAKQNRQCLASGMKTCAECILEDLLGVDTCWIALI